MSSMRSAVFAVVATGCYHAAPPQGAPCDPDAPVCPDGQTCVAAGGTHVCSATDRMPDGGGGSGSDADPPALDDDGDGIANAIDNCRDVANALQSDEDADSFGDACDVCPPFADNTDGDGDGVGDLCDPNPARAGEQLVLFEGFDGPMPPGWIASGAWSTSTGSLISTVSGANQNTLVTSVAASAQQTMYASMTLTGIESGQSGGALGIVDRFDAGATVGVMCGGARGNGGFLALVIAANGRAFQAEPHPIAIGTTFALRFKRNDNNYACTDTLAGQTVNGSAGPSGTLVGFRNRVLSASYAWFLVVRSP
jgi:hypothetical protein